MSSSAKITCLVAALAVCVLLSAGIAYLLEPKIPKDTPPDVRALIIKLKSANPQDRTNAAYELGEMWDRAVPAVPFLVRMLGDWKTARKPLTSDSDTNPRTEARIALEKIGYPAVTALIDAMRSRSRDRRNGAAEALGNIRDVRAFDPLLAALERNPQNNAATTAPNFNLIEAAITALGKIGDRRTVEPILAGLNSNNRLTYPTRAAVQALGLIRDPRAIEPLADFINGIDNSGFRPAFTRQVPQFRRDEQDRADAVRALANIRDPAVIEHLSRFLQLETSDSPGILTPTDQAQAYAAEKLGEMDDPRVVPLIAGLLTDNSNIVREAAVKALGQHGDPRAVGPLLDALQLSTLQPQEVGPIFTALARMGEPGIRALLKAVHSKIPAHLKRDQWDRDLLRVARSDERFDDPRIVDFLGEVLATSENETACQAAAMLLGKAKDPRAVDALLATLTGHKNAGVRGSAAAALGDLGDRRAVEPLIAVMTKTTEIHLETAAESLAKLKDPRAIEALLAQLPTAAGYAKQQVIAALGAIGDPRAEAALLAAAAAEQDPWHRFHIARALGKLRNPKAVEMLADVIRTDTADKLYRTRSAIRELGVIGGERAAEALYFAMEQHGAAIHGDAYVALAEMGDTSAVIPLAAMLIDTNSSGSRFDVRHFPFREEAASALAKLGDPRVIPHLISTLRHEEEPVGKAAQQALEKLTGQNFGRDLAKWQKWWRANRERLLSAHNSAAPFAPKHSAK